MKYRSIVILCAAFFLAGLLSLNEMFVYTPDSAHYLVWANSLAKFDGFVDRISPEPVRYVVHAPLYSLLLAPAEFAFPNSVVAAKFVTLLFGTAMLALFYVWTRGKTTAGIALGATALLALNPLVLIHSTQILSEMPFTLALILFFIWNEKLAGEGQTKPDATEWKMIAASVSLFFLREIGLTMIAGTVLFYGLKKEYRRALLVALVCGVCYALWHLRNEVWIAGIEHPPLRNSRLFAAHMFTPQDSSMWSELWARFVSNGTVYLNYLGKLILMPDFVPHSHRMITPTDADVKLAFFLLRIVQYPVIVATLGLSAWGGWKLMNDRRRYLLYAIVGACYIVPILLYPINDVRFLMPILLVMLHCSAFAVHDLAKGFAVLPWRRAAYRVSIIALGLVMVPNIVWVRSFVTNSRWYANDTEGFIENVTKQERYAEQFVQPVHLAARWLAAHTEASDVILCRWRELYFWMNGQKVLSYNSEMTPETFDYVLRDCHPSYLVSVVSTNQLREWEVLIATSVRFRFETVYRAGNVEVMKILPKERFPQQIPMSVPRTAADSVRSDFARALSMLNHAQAAAADSLLSSISHKVGSFGPIVLHAGVAKEFMGDLAGAETALQSFRAQQQAGSLAQYAWYHLEIIARLQAAESEPSAVERAVKLNTVAVNYREMGFKEQSYFTLERSMHAAPNFFPAIVLTGVYRLQDGDIPAATEALARARDIDSSNTLARNLWEVVHLRTNTAALAHDTGLRVAELYEECGMREDAIDAYQQILAAAPDDTDALRNLARLFEFKRRFAPAREMTQRLLRVQPHNELVRAADLRLADLLWE